MNPQQKQEPLDSKKINEILTQMKKEMGRVKGERDMMENDTISSMMQNFANLIGKIYQEKESSETKLKGLQATIDKIYQGHPDIKVSMEKPEEKPKKK
jgi:hypothetical protein